MFVLASHSKRWTLFAPDECPQLYPTRIPYEESSVFSSVNIRKPNLAKHPKFANVRPYTVVLNPGDALYVPNKWWHFVECVRCDNCEHEPTNCVALSINMWRPLSCDRRARVSEAVIKTLASALFPMYEPRNANWINDVNGESDLDPGLSLQLLNEALTIEKTPSAQQTSNLDADKEDCITIDESSCVTRLSEVTLAQLAADLKWPHVDGVACQSKNGPTQLHSAHDNLNNCDLNVSTIMNAILSPDVVALVVDKLCQV